MDAGKIHKIEDAIEIGEGLRNCWFRGHAEVFNSLSPCIHRDPFRSAPRENIEFWAAQRFRLRAASYATNLPAWEDYVSWLLLMQHHGVPTRLLDWTENVLVGVYFAVCEPAARDSKDADGELWCMNHDELNWRSADYRACFPDTPPIRYLAAAPFLTASDLETFKATLGWQKPINGPIALIPSLQFPRIAAQKSRFTIHPSTQAEARIEFLLRGSSLVRYIIPASAKTGLAKHLARLGFSHETLFCSLDSLAKTIKDEIIERDYEQGPPPRFE